MKAARSKYYQFHRQYTIEEKRLIISKVILVATEIALGHHIYQCQNLLYRQLRGGGIGARLTGIIARLIMDVWMDRMTEILQQNKVEIYLMVKYVDDINIATDLIKDGYKWQKEGDQWVLRWSEEMSLADRNRSRESATIQKIKWIGDRLIPGLRLTYDIPELHPNKRCPMLDFQVWAEELGGEAVIRHTFFEKDTSSPLVFHANSAYSWKPKITTLAEELGRRFCNMDQHHTEEERDEVVKRFLQKLVDSGYNKEHREEIIKSGCKRFSRRLIQDATPPKAQELKLKPGAQGSLQNLKTLNTIQTRAPKHQPRYR